MEMKADQQKMQQDMIKFQQEMKKDLQLHGFEVVSKQLDIILQRLKIQEAKEKDNGGQVNSN
jgi:hypothetical protein